MLKILQAHLLRAFVAKLKIYAIYALYPESFCDKNLAIRKVFAFCDSARHQDNQQHEGEGLYQCGELRQVEGRARWRTALRKQQSKGQDL